MSSISGQQDFDNVAKDGLSHTVNVEESMDRSLGISRAKLLRKIDLILMPMVRMAFSLCILDMILITAHGRCCLRTECNTWTRRYLGLLQCIPFRKTM